MVFIMRERSHIPHVRRRVSPCFVSLYGTNGLERRMFTIKLAYYHTLLACDLGGVCFHQT